MESEFETGYTEPFLGAALEKTFMAEEENNTRARSLATEPSCTTRTFNASLRKHDIR